MAGQNSADFIVPQLAVGVLEELVRVDLIAVGVLALSVPSVLPVWVGHRIDVSVYHF